MFIGNTHGSSDSPDLPPREQSALSPAPTRGTRRGRAERDALPVPARAVLVGAASIAVLALINPFLAFVTLTWSIGDGSLIRGAVEVLFALILINSILLRFLPVAALSRPELCVVYGMVIIPAHLLFTGGIPYMVSCTTYPFYMATPGADWDRLIWPNIPLWLQLSDPEAVRWFWEGLPDGVGVPWHTWTHPVLGWSSLTVALAAAMFCLGALLSKDWIEKQRLTFPLVAVPLALTGDDPRPSLRSSVLNDRVFWLGFAIPAACALLRWLHPLFSAMPTIELHGIEIGRYFAGMGLPWSSWAGMQISVIFSVIGITCLVPSEVSLSLWLFYVLYRVQQLLWASFGVTQSGGSELSIDPQAFIGFEEAGGFIAFSAMALYQSRSAIRTAWLSLCKRTREEADPLRPISGRAALLGFVLANAFMFWWSSKAGMSWWAFGAWLGVFYAVLIGVSRLVAAAGVMHVDTAVFTRGVILSMLGTYPLGPKTLTMYSYLSVIYTYDPRSVLMPQMMNSFKLMHTARVRGISFTRAAAIALVVALAVGFPALLHLVYRKGATSLPVWPFTSYPAWGFMELHASLESPQMPNNWLRLAMVVGAAFTAVMVWFHNQFLWWPVSPVGFLIASSYETNRSIWFNALIAWCLTTLIRRYGGLSLYRKLYPAFLGLVLGDFLPRGLLALASTLLGIRQPIS